MPLMDFGTSAIHVFLRGEEDDFYSAFVVVDVTTNRASRRAMIQRSNRARAMIQTSVVVASVALKMAETPRPAKQVELAVGLILLTQS